jgi:hypothetical protein
MIDFGLFTFASPPGTGIDWILKASNLIGLGKHQKEQSTFPFQERNGDTRLKVSVVRHPCDWLGDCWASLRGGLNTENQRIASFACLRNDSFDDFVRSYLEIMPGGIERFFADYRADVCWKLEDLPWAFLLFMQTLGVPRRLLEGCKHLDRGLLFEWTTPFWEPSLKKRVREAEKRFTERYEYYY